MLWTPLFTFYVWYISCFGGLELIEAKIICDSINQADERITSFIVTFPKFILAEFNTHRMISRNSASSRAIPVKAFIDKVVNTPFVPNYLGKAGKGMQAAEEISDEQRNKVLEIWLNARDNGLKSVDELLALGLHKQLANRIIELWAYTTVLCTATEWENFFSLRAHADAQPEFQELAYKMLDAYNLSEPQSLYSDEWHIPFGDRVDKLAISDKLKVATARAARVSYETFDGEIDYQKDFDLHDKLKESGHWSPFEHAAQADPNNKWGNFKGWKQYRKLFNTENRSDNRVIKKFWRRPNANVSLGEMDISS